MADVYNAEKYINDESLEMGWAIKSIDHAETHFNMLTSLDPSLLKLTAVDDDIYTRFIEEFPDLDIVSINEDEMKSKEGKEKWQPFCMEFEGVVDDYNFGTLLRSDSTLDYSRRNSFIVPRIQFLAIEIARNRRGHNDHLKKAFGQAQQSKTQQTLTDSGTEK